MKAKFARSAALIGCVPALLSTSGCGGGGVALINPTRIVGILDENDSRFSDGSLSEFYIATARRSGRAQIEMESTAFDVFLIISTRNSDGEIENIIEDDNSGEDQNAKVIFDVKKGQTYFIAALDNGAVLAPGPYTITFSDILTDVKVNPDSLPTTADDSRVRQP